MNDQPPGGGPLPPDETGEPIAELAELRVKVSAGFLGRVRRAVDRRSLTTSVMGLCWFVPAVVLLELVTLVFGLVGDSRNGEGGNP